jgi:hypothetical protein
MKFVRYLVPVGVIIVIFTFSIAAANANVIFHDDFSSGNFSKILNAAKWLSPHNVAVVNQTARFEFKGNPNPSAHSFAELRFDLGRLYPEIWVQFRLFVPANYKHRYPNSSASNKKLFRLWPQGYNDVEKVGFQMWRRGDDLSSVQGDWNTGSGIGPKGDYAAAFITEMDKGKWMTIRIHAKAPTSSTQHGTLRLWKNGTLIINNSNSVNNFKSGESHAFRYGYLLGWSNSGFDVDTYLNIDDVLFATTSSGLDSGSGSPSLPPSTPSGPVSPRNLRIIE